MAEEFDLFGMPILPRGETRGRPQHVASLENRNRVNMLLALGWSNERIAAALCITPPTLRRHYFSELKYREVARDRLNMRRAEQFWREAEKGNVGAMKAFGEFLKTSDLMEFGQTTRPPAATPKPEKLGKKEAALAAAKQPDAASPLGQLMAQRQGRAN